MIPSYVILEEDRLRDAVKHFMGKGAFVFDFESMGEHRGVSHLNTLSWISMATEGATIVVPFGHPIGTKVVGEHKETRTYAGDGPRAGTKYQATVLDYEPPPKQISPANVFDILRPLFFSETIIKIGHGVIFDLCSGAKYWDAVPLPPYDDSLICDWILDENRMQYGLKTRAKEKYGFIYDDENVGKCVEKFPFNLVAYYSWCDAKLPWWMWNDYRPRITAAGLDSVHRLEMDVLNVLIGMRLAGSRVDVERLKELKVELAEAKVEAEGVIYKAAGKTFNINSVPARQTVLFGPKKAGNQGLTPWKMTDGAKKAVKAGGTRGKDQQGWSTDDEVLESFPNNPVAAALREYSVVHKLLSNYVLSYLGDPSDKKKPCQIYDEHIYADFVQYGTTTGRFSCRAPNLQNIPRPDTERGKIIRGAWVADPGCKLVVADYGQIELVVFAHYAGEGALFDGFWEGIDPHTTTASAILRKDPADVLPGERQKFGKTMNFTMAFGAGLMKVAAMLDVSVDEARQVLANHRRAMPEIYRLKDNIISACRSRTPPCVYTLSGRRRTLNRINSSDDGLRRYAERQAVSSVIQGSAADLIKMAMVRADSDPRMGDDIHLTLTVHDELVMLAPDAKAELAQDILRDAMTGRDIQALIKVPLKAEIKAVDRWSQAK